MTATILVTFLIVCQCYCLFPITSACTWYKFYPNTNIITGSPPLIQRTTTVAYITNVTYAPASKYLTRSPIGIECGHTVYYNDNDDLAPRQRNYFRNNLIGGDFAMPNEYPWIVRLLLNSKERGQFYCAGAVIDNQWVLTTATCLTFSSRDTDHVTVLLAEARTNVGNTSSTTAQPTPAVPAMNLTVGYSGIFLHPLFGPVANRFNFALLRLPVSLDFSSWSVQPICLPSAACDAPCSHQVRYTLEIAGFGGTSAGDRTSLPFLRKAYVPLVETVTCQMAIKDTYRKSYNIGVENLCAGYPQGGIDLCNNDLGAPLMCIDQGRYFLTGLASDVGGCGAANFYSIYSNVCMARNWIDQTMRKHSLNLPFASIG